MKTPKSWIGTLVLAIAACSEPAPTPETANVVELDAAAATLRFVDVVGYDVASTPARLGRFELANDTAQPWILYGTQRSEGLVVAGPFARIEQRDDEDRWITPFGDDAASPPPPDSITLGPGGHERIAVELPAVMFGDDLRDGRWRMCLALDAVSEACSGEFRIGAAAAAQ